MAYYTFLALIWFGVTAYQTYVVVAGKASDYLCSIESVEKFNETLD